MNFDSNFWQSKLKELGYRITFETFDIDALKEQRVIPKDTHPVSVQRLSDEELVEVALITLDRDKKQLTRSRCATIARSWKENRMVKPFLLFTDGVDSYAVIVPGRGIGGEAKILSLSVELYRTDHDVLASVRHPGTVDELNKNYDEVFFPYQKVRDEFFQSYRDLYQKLEKQVRKLIPGDSSGYSQRFLGRLMFLYFLQRKGWLKEDRKYIDSIRDYRELNEIIYEGLCTGSLDGIPFLNGSLFEREPYLDEAMGDALFPKVNPVFLEARSFFNQFNFTVDEASPLDLDVSIDPALIGTVFENMLPEQERGSKGTFYTPRNEISFICRRALANWLGLRDEVKPLPGGGEEFVDGLDALVENLREKRDEARVRELKKKVLSAKVLDPAVGSGGFLLGAMQEIIGFIHGIEETVGWRTDPEELKRKILPNLYGFDIESEAVEIARLRLWLSLIIDQRAPTPLPNLDLNLVTIQDSLKKSMKEKQMTFGNLEKAKRLRERFHELSSRYLNETDAARKAIIKEERLRVSEELDELTGLDPNTIEASMHGYADIVVMNPPFVRQEEIPEEKKEIYVKQYGFDKKYNLYGLDKKSDLFAYFLVRVHDLLAENGVASVISSDKWLETGYGESLQKKLVNHIVSIYGQRERSFGADINTVITVYTKQTRRDPVSFTYIEKYGEKKVVRSVSRQRRQLTPGKWFYLRAPKFFVENVLPKLTHQLGALADIKRGFTTGANEFFYMKEINHLYEADYRANSKRFKEWGVTANTQKELEEQGLAYIENEGGQRFVLEKEGISPLIRSIRNYSAPLIPDLIDTFCFNVTTLKGLPFCKKYVEWGQSVDVQVTRGSRPKTVKGYNQLQTTKTRPTWYMLPSLKPAKIALPELFSSRFLSFYHEEAALADHLFDVVYPKKERVEKQYWMYFNSTIFWIMLELWSPRMGGGALHPRTMEYKSIPTPDLDNLIPYLNKLTFGERTTLPYDEEIRQPDKITLDEAVLYGLGFNSHEVTDSLPKLYKEYLEVVNDRLIKASSSISKKAKRVQENIDDI